MIALTRPARSRLPSPSLPVLIAVFGAIFGALVVFAVITESADDAPPVVPVAPDAAQRAAVEAYADALAPASEDAGRAIILGIRPDIVDFEAGELSVEVWQSDMDARHRQFERARAVFAAAPAPEIVGDAPQWFDRAFSTYLDAVTILRSAGDVDGAARTEFIDRGTDLGDRGDELFNRGALRLQEARRALGLGPDPRFPDPEAP